MAAPTIEQLPPTPSHPLNTNGHHDEDVDVFASPADLLSQPHHRFSSRFDIEPLDLSSTASPSQLKRTIEAHLQATDKRLQDTQQLGNSLLKQREDLSSKLEEVEQFQDEAQIPAELRRKLADIEREHADVSREVARALIAPKPNQDDSQLSDSGVFTSQATGSPTKVSAPSRRHRNQPSTRAGDLQFAADISTSLLAQVRQLQATVAERDESLRRVNSEREVIEHDLHNYSQKIRALDESEQKYKDENWNLETQRHELLTAAKDAQDKEKRLNAGLAAAVTERNRLQNELEDLKMNHAKLAEEHTAARKAHDTEIHGLKRNVDVADTERQSLQDRIDELVSQNQELAKAISNRSRSRQISPGEGFVSAREETGERLDTPEDSPPPSPTKATPRHGGLESETLRSSLHHSHRMIQNLKAQNHREKTEKIELRRMLQEARDELESRREGGSAAKRQKTKPEAFKKPARPDMLGINRRSRTDIELTDDDWEDQKVDSPTHARSATMLQAPRSNAQHLTDLSDAYQTANETEGTFDTADERNTTESEAFMTGAESLAGDSTDELTETEDTASTTGRDAPGRVGRVSLNARSAGDRTGYMSTASTSADEADNMQTPMQSSFTKFKLRSTRASYAKQPQLAEQSTPESFSSRSISHDSPASTMTLGQSPMIGEQSLFAELGGMDEINSEAGNTPARSSTMSSTYSTPGYPHTPSKAALALPGPADKMGMVNSSTMTEPWLPETTNAIPTTEKKLLPSAFPLPPSVPASPAKRSDNSTQYTPQRGMAESPSRPTSSHITPPKTVWDEAHDPSTPGRAEDRSLTQHGYSGVLSQDSVPMHSPVHDTAATQRQLEQLQADLAAKEAGLDELRRSNAAALAAAAASLESLRNTHATAQTQRQAELDALRSNHAADLARSASESEGLREVHALALSKKDTELEGLRNSHAASLADSVAELERLRGTHAANIASKETEIEGLRASHASELAKKESEIESLRNGHATDIEKIQSEFHSLRSGHTAVLEARQVEVDGLRNSHASELSMLREQLASHKGEIDNKQLEVDGLRSSHAAALASSQAELEHLRTTHGAESDKLKAQIASLSDEISRKRTELENLRGVHSEELDKLRGQISGYDQEMGSKETELNKLQAVHDAELEGLRRQIAGHGDEVAAKNAELEGLRTSHSSELGSLREQIAAHTQHLSSKHSELEAMQLAHNQEQERMRSQIDGNAEIVGRLQTNHGEELSKLQSQIAAQSQKLGSKQSELITLQSSHKEEVERLERKVNAKDELIQRLHADHSQELAKLHAAIYAHGVQVEQLQNALRASEAQPKALGSGYSAILSQETSPVAPQLAAPVRVERSESPERPRTAERVIGGGLLASAAAASGFTAGNKNQPTIVGEDATTSGPIEKETIDSTSSSLKDISGNVPPTRNDQSIDVFGGPLLKPTISHDQASQTVLGGEHLDQVLKPRKSPLPPVTIPTRNRSPNARTPNSPTRYPGRPSSRTREVSPIVEDPTAIPSSPPPRPSSASSNRTSSMVSQTHPPLPSDHRDIIAKANQSVSPTRQTGSTARQGGVMGPPVMPASAMRRPITPNESVRTASRVGQNGKRTTGSQLSKRSSVSSFASELDERFNIRADQQAASHGFEASPGTDPRMIQAITQTMIGEYLWKYTRKAGSKEMSNTRHRRYFWVHPYTKTLYWSDQDPQTAGRSELKAKSVAIESVRVVGDDNPMPPGLHRKSLEVTTPGRKVKFTASTGQRHETWFNALSYLLHRGEDQPSSGMAGGGGTDITNEDIAEFSVNGYGARLVPNDSRMSMSSYNSRTTAGTSRRVGRQSMPVVGVAGSSSSQVPQMQGTQSSKLASNNDTVRQTRLDVSQDKDRTIRASSVSRISRMFGSMTSRTKSDNAPTMGESSSQTRENSSIYDASVVSDGRNAEEEEARRQREQGDRPGLEDVRACCDGKHHVGSLAHRNTTGSATQNRLSNAINRSVSRRT